AQLDVDLDRLIELGVLELLEDLEALLQLVNLVRVDLGPSILVALARLVADPLVLGRRPGRVGRRGRRALGLLGLRGRLLRSLAPRSPSEQFRGHRTAGALPLPNGVVGKRKIIPAPARL